MYLKALRKSIIDIIKHEHNHALSLSVYLSPSLSLCMNVCEKEREKFSLGSSFLQQTNQEKIYIYVSNNVKHVQYET